MAPQSSAVVWVSRLVIFTILYILQGYVPIVPFLVSKGEVGIILSTQAWASVAALLPAGFGIDKYGARAVLQLGVFISFASIALMAFATFQMQLLARILLGAATSDESSVVTKTRSFCNLPCSSFLFLNQTYLIYRPIYITPISFLCQFVSRFFGKDAIRWRPSLSGWRQLLVIRGWTQVIFNSAMALIMEHFSEPKRSEHLGLAVGLGSLGLKTRRLDLVLDILEIFRH